MQENRGEYRRVRENKGDCNRVKGMRKSSTLIEQPNGE